MHANRFALVCATLALGWAARGQAVLDESQTKDGLADILWVDAGEAAYFLGLLQLDDRALQDATAAHEAYADRLVRAGAATRREGADGKLHASWDMLALEDRVGPMQEAFFAELGAIAAAAGRGEAFGRVERARRREATAFLEGSSPLGVDLVLVAYQSGVAGEPIRETLVHYEVEIDPLHETSVAAMPKFAHLAADPPEGDPAPPLEIELDEEGFPTEEEMAQLDEGRASLLARDAQAKAINDKYAALIAEALPEADKARWLLAVKRREWPRVYAVSEAERTLALTDWLQDLTPEQRKELVAIRSEHETEASEINGRWATAIEARDAAERTDDWGVWNRQIERADAAQAERAGLDRATIARVEALLTPGQLESLRAASNGGPAT